MAALDPGCTGSVIRSSTPVLTESAVDYKNGRPWRKIRCQAYRG